MPVVLENAAMRVVVLPDYGGRVTSLVGKQAGREWIAPGGQSGQTGEEAVFGADEAVGWDECFPTVSPWDGSATAWQRPLRDHGELWGRPWSVEARTGARLAARYAARDYIFSRTLALDGAVLSASYRVESRATAPLPFLWALHGLLSAAPADRIVLPGVDALDATYLSAHHGQAPGAVPFPDSRAAFGFRLDEVQPEAARFAGKFYARPAKRCAAVGHGDQWLVIRWGEPIDSLGVWLNYGGWPEPPRGHHLALEPTTAPADHLGQALERGQAAWIAPGAVAEWTVTLALAGAAP